jgi:hypothetical protein
MIDSEDARRRLERAAASATVRFPPQARHFIPGQAETIPTFLLGEPLATSD